MIHALYSPVSFLRQRVSALLHRNDRLKADAAERRERWNQVVAEHRKPLDEHPGTSTSSSGRA
jgi:hypothetical protein